MPQRVLSANARCRGILFLSLLLLIAGCSKGAPLPAPSALDAESPPGYPDQSVLLSHAQSLTDTAPEKNWVTLLETGSDALLSRIHLIRSAKKSLSLQTLIWANDEVGRLFMYELIQAARRGVRVRFLIDHLSSERHIELTTFLAYAHPCLEIKLFNPVPGLFSQPKAKSLFLEKLYTLVWKFERLNHRMHNKTFIVDDQIAITGGRNYQNAYYDQATGMNYKDRDILAIGPVVGQMSKSFETYWESKYAVDIYDLHDIKNAIHDGRFEDLSTRENFLLNGLLEHVNSRLKTPSLIRERFVEELEPVEAAYYVSDSPRKRDRLLLWFGGHSEITRQLADIVSGAEESVYIQTPYLILTRPAVSLFKRLRKEHPGLDIRISTNSLAATDSWHVYAISYKQKQTYLQTLKFRIYEFKPLPDDMGRFMPGVEELKARRHGRNSAEDVKAAAGGGSEGSQPYLCLHGKSLVVDDKVAFVGSYNLDPRSENINTESGLFVHDRKFARKLRAYMEQDMEPRNSWVIARKKRPLGLSYPNAMIARLSDILPLIDPWPFRYSASFELKDGRQAVEPDHPDFYDNYKDVGSFPEVRQDNFGKELGARGTKAFLSLVKPLL